MTLGSMWRKMIRACLKPAARAASTYGISRMASALERMTRAQRGIIGMVIARITFGSAVAEDHHDRQRQDDQREREEDVHEALEDEVEPPAEVRAGDPEDRPGRGAEHRGAEAHQERRPRAVDEARETSRP